MGIETVALIGLSVFSADQQIRQAKKEAEAIVAQGNIESSNKAEEIRKRTARAKVSFFNSGLTLEGTPLTTIEGMFDAGIEDLNLIKSNADTRAKNTLSAARNNAILGLAKTGLGAAAGAGAFEGVSNSLSFGTGKITANSFGQSLASGFNSQAIGPFQDPFKFN